MMANLFYNDNARDLPVLYGGEPMSLNGLRSPAERRRTVGSLYSKIKNGTPSRDITVDEDGVLAFCGSQMTSNVWFGERTDFDDETVTYRVLKIEPTRSDGFNPSPRTGVPVFGSRLTNVRYVVKDVTLPCFSQQASLGRVLSEVKEAFRQSQSLERGNVHSDHEVASVYQKLF